MGDAFAAHDHAACQRAALEQVAAACAARGLRLTPVRRRTLELLWRTHKPVGAYELLDALAADGFRAHPPTVYRALEFLVANGFAHRVAGANAFVGCARPGTPHTPHFLICGGCGETRELFDDRLADALAAALADADFRAERASIEVEGVCALCARAAERPL